MSSISPPHVLQCPDRNMSISCLSIDLAALKTTFKSSLLLSDMLYWTDNKSLSLFLFISALNLISRDDWNEEKQEKKARAKTITKKHSWFKVKQESGLAVGNCPFFPAFFQISPTEGKRGISDEVWDFCPLQRRFHTSPQLSFFTPIWNRFHFQRPEYFVPPSLQVCELWIKKKIYTFTAISLHPYVL